MTAFRIYGRPVTTNIEDDTPLLWVIRDVIGLTGTKFGIIRVSPLARRWTTFCASQFTREW